MNGSTIIDTLVLLSDIIPLLATPCPELRLVPLGNPLGVSWLTWAVHSALGRRQALVLAALLAEAARQLGGPQGCSHSYPVGIASTGNGDWTGVRSAALIATGKSNTGTRRYKVIDLEQHSFSMGSPLCCSVASSWS